MIEINQYLSTKDFLQIVNQNNSIKISSTLTDNIQKSHDFLKDFSINKIIYGVNTGFGPMAQYRVSDEDGIQLQYNLIRSHAAGVGKVIPTQNIRAAMVARLNSICRAKSGVHPSVPKVLIELINKEVYPVIYEHGGVGASGDLVQLSHLALGLIGEGEVIYKGERKKTSVVFEELGIKPIKVTIREGLSLINGTSLMTGIGLLNVQRANTLLEWAINCSALINELVASYDDHISAELNGAKMHRGQVDIAEKMRAHVSDSKLMKKREQHLYTGKNKETFFKEKVQEYYSLRCVPQILGPILETLQHSSRILEEELNSANDNPIIDYEKEQVFHGGNFHGDYVSLEMDKMKMAVTRMSMLAERQLNYLLNHKINGLLPPFVTRGVLGLNYGMQAAQFTATSTTAENQTLSNPMYVHSIPCNNDNQDIVSMGTNAAQITSKVIENAFEVLSIELITIYQAIRHTDKTNQLSSKSKEIMHSLGEVIPDIIEDNPLYPIIEKTKDYLMK